ncbi:MAG: ATP-binding protein [Xanthobacteraceae bacterium]
MSRRGSILSRIVVLHILVVIGTAMLLRSVLHWSLTSDVASLQLKTMETQAERFARHLRHSSAGGWTLDLPAGIRDQYSDAYGRYGYAIVDDTGAAIFSSRGDNKPLFAVARGMPDIVPHKEQTPGGTRTIAGASIRKTVGGDNVWIQISEDLSHRDVIVDDLLNDFLQQAVWIIVPALLLLLIADVIIFRMAVKPLHRASDRAMHISPTRLDVRLPTEDMPSEIRPLADAVNQALDRLEQGFRRQREFAADAAHELRTPLAILRTRIETLPRSDTAQALGRDVESMSRVVSQLLDATELETILIDPGETVDIHQVCLEVVEFIAPLALQRNKSIELAGTEAPVSIMGNAELIRRATRNLVENAILHTPEGTTIEVIVNPAGSISVVDNGGGISPADRDVVFQRFWRRDRRAGGGAGLGLSIVKKIVDAHEGSISLEDGPMGGTKFTMHFRLSNLLGAIERNSEKISSA